MSKTASDMTDAQELMEGLRKFSSVPRRARHQRPLRGKATIKANLLRKKGVDVVLRVSQGFLSIVGGPELEDRLLHIPLLHAVINPVPDQDNVFLLDIDDPDQTDQMSSGVFVVVNKHLLPRHQRNVCCQLSQVEGDGLFSHDVSLCRGDMLLFF